MSPSENDLRAALRAGDDERLDVDVVVAGAERFRRRRRTRVLSTTAAVVVVAGLATALPLVTGGSDTGPAAGNEGPSVTRSATAPSGGPTASPGVSPQVLSALAALRCPTRPSQMLQAGGGGTSQFGAGGPIFAVPVAATLVCEYDSATVGLGGTPSTLRLSGADAAELAASLDDASHQPLNDQRCSDAVQRDPHAVSVQALTGAAERLPLVSTAVDEPICQVRVTNGTALRFGWTPPQDLAGRFATLQPGDAQPAH